MKQIETRTEKEILTARVKEAETAMVEAKRNRRTCLIALVTDEHLDLARPYLNGEQQRALLKMDTVVREASQTFYSLQQELEGRFPPPLPELPPSWEIDPVQLALTAGKTIDEAKAFKASVNFTPALAGIHADQTLRKRWSQGGEELNGSQ